jgi:hypothetical protein
MRARTDIDIRPRPAPGAPAPEPDQAGSSLAAARLVLGALDAHPSGCRCNAWCRDDWTYAAHGAPALGPCCVCAELCRSIGPEGRLRHPNCETGAAA